MTKENINNLVSALSSALIAFSSIEAKMSPVNIQYGKVVTTNIQAVLKTLQEFEKQNNNELSKESHKAEEAADKACKQCK